jgi:hypothetical protein
MDIPGNSSVIVSFALQVRSPGPFADSIRLYVDDGSLEEIRLSIKGAAKHLSSLTE